MQTTTHQSARAELATLDQWLVSKIIDGDKPPLRLNADGDKLIGASHSNPDHWTTYSEALDTVERGIGGAEGLGFCFHKADPYTGIDLDGCRDPETGIIEPWAHYWIDLLHSYTEISKSGRGVKIWVRGKVDKQRQHALGAHKGYEVYGWARYFWMTFDHLAGTPETIEDAQPALDQLMAHIDRLEAERKVSKATPAIERTTATPAAARDGESPCDCILRENDLGNLLEDHGATLMKTSGTSRYYSGLNGDKHSHKVTYVVSAATKRPGQIGFSYSSGGKLNKSDFPRGFNYIDAKRELEGVDLVPAKAERTSARQERPHYTPEQAAAYNANRQAQRQAERRATLDRWTAYIAQLDMSDRAHMLASYLLDQAHDAGVLQVRPTNAEIAEALGYCERYVTDAFRELQAHDLGKRHGGRGGAYKAERAIWSFGLFPSSLARNDTNEGAPLSDAVCDLVYIHEDSYTESVQASERGAAVEPAPEWECWEACEVEHGADELNAIEAEPVLPMGEICNILQNPPRVGRSGPRWWAELGGTWSWWTTEHEAQIAAGLVVEPPPVVERGTDQPSADDAAIAAQIAALYAVEMRKPRSAIDDQQPLDLAESTPAPKKPARPNQRALIAAMSDEQLLAELKSAPGIARYGKQEHTRQWAARRIPLLEAERLARGLSEQQPATRRPARSTSTGSTSPPLTSPSGNGSTAQAGLWGVL